MRGFQVVGILIGIWLGIAASAAAEEVPQFSAFPEKIYAGPNALVRLATKDERNFATRLRRAVSQPANFAGHYIFATWGCGAECLGGAVIDARTGKVAWLPYSVCCWGKGEPFSFKNDSRLIVFSGILNEESPKGAHFFEFRNGKFKHLTSRAEDGSILSGIPKPAK
ncbi:hypothetical protein [Neorhizobium alkalisoli]|uniref:hypothetical protein n=1 Tax=Neorhizobium alkalisoli TaxID=528178 RepID=UPI000CF92E01|nr:hypothetical protein [Neorhizobium alkalisoli]